MFTSSSIYPTLNYFLLLCVFHFPLFCRRLFFSDLYLPCSFHILLLCFCSSFLPAYSFPLLFVFPSFLLSILPCFIPLLSKVYSSFLLYSPIKAHMDNDWKLTRKNEENLTMCYLLDIQTSPPSLAVPSIISLRRFTIFLAIFQASHAAQLAQTAHWLGAHNWAGDRIFAQPRYTQIPCALPHCCVRVQWQADKQLNARQSQSNMVAATS